MNLEINIKSYQAPPVDMREILRYAGCRECNEEIEARLRECLAEVEDRLAYKVCYRELPTRQIQGEMCDFGVFSCRSAKLAAHLQGCGSVLLFGATVGVELDRLIARYGRISPTKAVLLQAIGAERIEALCDLFCEEYAKEKRITLKSRFSPGYGDLSLEVQRDIFRLLDLERSIGLFLNNSLLMSPSKSVTAFVGLEA